MSEVPPIIVSWSELDTYRQCPFKHELAYVQRYNKPVPDDSPLGKGVLWHSVIETRYRVIHAHQVMDRGVITFDVGEKELNELCLKAVDALLLGHLKAGMAMEVISLMWWMYNGYVEKYGLDLDHKVMGVETTHVAPLGNIHVPVVAEGNIGAQLRVTPVLLKFKIDRTVRDKYGHVRVIDEKSHGQLPSDNDYDFLDQFGLYVWGLRKLGIDVRGAIHSASKTKQNQGDIFKEGMAGWKSTMKETPLDSRYKRTNIHFTPAQLKGIADDALADVQQMYTGANHRRRHTDSDRCKWRCSYTEACLFGRRTGKPGDTIKMLEIQGFTQERERH